MLSLIIYATTGQRRCLRNSTFPNVTIPHDIDLMNNEDIDFLNALSHAWRNSDYAFFTHSAYSACLHTAQHKSLTRLFENQCIDDEQIRNYWQYFSNHFSMDCDQSTYCIESALLYGTDSKTAVRYSKSYENQGLHNKEIYLLPYHTGGHWFLAIYLHYQGLFVVMDSKPAPDDVYGEYMLKFAWILKTYFGVKNLSKDFPIHQVYYKSKESLTAGSQTEWAGQYSLLVLPEIPLQAPLHHWIRIWKPFWKQGTNDDCGVDCGIYVIFTMTYLYRHNLFHNVISTCTLSQNPTYPRLPDISYEFIKEFRCHVFTILATQKF